MWLTHGGSYDVEYRIYHGMLGRCYYKGRGYKHYGGRGIRVCKRWRFGDETRSGYECFLADMGRRPSPKHSLDRINNDLHYLPGNCRWATQNEQHDNRRNTCIVEYDGRRIPLVHLSQILSHVNGIPRGVIHLRLKRGWPPDRAAMTPTSYGTAERSAAARKWHQAKWGS